MRTGYRFAGWYEDEELTTPYTIPAKMPNKERMVYAKWEAEDVGYQVVEYLEGTNGVYEAQDPIRYSGLTDTEVTPKPAGTRRIRNTEGKDRNGTGRRNDRG